MSRNKIHLPRAPRTSRDAAQRAVVEALGKSFPGTANMFEGYWRVYSEASMMLGNRPTSPTFTPSLDEVIASVAIASCPHTANSSTHSGDPPLIEQLTEESYTTLDMLTRDRSDRLKRRVELLLSLVSPQRQSEIVLAQKPFGQYGILPLIATLIEYTAGNEQSGGSLPTADELLTEAESLLKRMSAQRVHPIHDLGLTRLEPLKTAFARTLDVSICGVDERRLWDDLWRVGDPSLSIAFVLFVQTLGPRFFWRRICQSAFGAHCNGLQRLYATSFLEQHLAGLSPPEWTSRFEGWTEEQGKGALESEHKSFTADSTGSARKWWDAFKHENQHRPLSYLKLNDVLRWHMIDVAEFFLAYVYSNTDNIQANVHYTLFTRIKKWHETKTKRKPSTVTAQSEAHAKPCDQLVSAFWHSRMVGNARLFSLTPAHVEAELDRVLTTNPDLCALTIDTSVRDPLQDQELGLPINGSWSIPLAITEFGVGLVVKPPVPSEALPKYVLLGLLNELERCNATFEQFRLAWIYSNSKSICASLEYLHYTRLKEEEARKRKASQRK